MAKRQVTKERFFAVTYVYVSRMSMGDPSNVVVAQHDALWWSRRARLYEIFQQTGSRLRWKKN